MSGQLIKKGKLLALLLRHKPEHLDLTLDSEGWALVKDLVDTGKFTKELLEEIVETNDKKRYVFNEDKTKIRALQGHSIDVNLNLKPLKEVPEFLYHGTQWPNVDSIKTKGLNKGARHHVHLSKDLETADKVATRRKGNSVILTILAQEMHERGFEFYLTQNNVYLTDFVPGKYIKV